MKCLDNLERINYPSELVMDLTKLYCFKGKDFYYEDVLKNDMPGIIKGTVEKDTFYASKLLKLDITENRTRLIIKKNAHPKTKDETVLANLKNVFTLIQSKGDEIELTSNEFLQLAKKVFDNVTDVGFAYEIIKVRTNILEEKKRRSKREDFDHEMSLFKNHLRSEMVEHTQLITNLYIDILKMNVYSLHNEFLSLLVYYCLLFRERFNVFKYVSFFQMYFEDLDNFTNATVAAGFNWEEGYAKTAILNGLLIKSLLKSYEYVESKANEYSFDKCMRKKDNVEAAILKLGDVFTRDEIKNMIPGYSDSTINRALANLKEQNKIRPTGTGRSAKWVRLVPDEYMTSKIKQMTLFDMMVDSDDSEENN